MLGWAVGVVGMSVEDFELMDFDDFWEVSKAYREAEKEAMQGEWNRMRLLATYVVMPYSKGITPEKLLPLPWDKETSIGKPQQTRHMSRADHRKRMAEVLERIEQQDNE